MKKFISTIFSQGRHTPTLNHPGSRSTPPTGPNSSLQPSQVPRHPQPQDRLAAIRSAKARGAESLRTSQPFRIPTDPSPTSQPHNSNRPQIPASPMSHVDNAVSQAGLGSDLMSTQSSPTTYGPTRADMPSGRTPPVGRSPVDRGSREGEDPRFRPYRPSDPRRDGGTTDPRLRRN